MLKRLPPNGLFVVPRRRILKITEDKVKVLKKRIFVFKKKKNKKKSNKKI